MGFLKRMASILGFLHGNADDGDGGADDEDRAPGKDEAKRRASAASASASASAPRKGFSVQVPLAVERPQVAPVLVPCNPGEGGVQGFKWYGKQLRVDEDGDVADEFLDEVWPEEAFVRANHGTRPTFKVNCSTRPAAVGKQTMSSDGIVRQSVEHGGRLKWV